MKRFNAKQVEKLVVMLTRVPMNDSERAACAARRERVKKYRRRIVRKVLKMVSA